jgi:pilus assembly protein CpaB
MLALVFGLAGGALTLIYLKQKGAQASNPVLNTVPVVVATTDLTFGTVIRAEHLETVHYPDNSVPPGSYAAPDSLIGQTTKVFLTSKEPILATKLTSIGGGLSIRIPNNMRATSMNVNQVSGVSGFVLPGDRVDVVAVIDRAGQVNQAITKTILQNIEVLASGQRTEEKSDKPVKVQSVTLLVDPEGAEKLALALHEGKLHLVLRNPGDHAIADVRSISTSEMTGGVVERAPRPRTAPKPKPEPVAAAPAPPPPTPKVTLIKGVKVEEQEPASERQKSSAPQGTTPAGRSD